MKINFSYKKCILIPIAILVFFLLLLLMLHLYRLHEKHTQEPVSILFATDVHLLASEYTGDHFYEPSAIFDGKLTHYSNEYFDAFLAEVLEEKPKLLILSGDLTLNGSVKSHEAMVSRLTQLQEAGIDVLVIPGNHDVNVTAGDYSSEDPVIVESLTAYGFFSYYENFGPAQAISRDSSSFSYIYEVTPYLRIIMLDTNCVRKGFVTGDTLDWLEKELLSAKLAGADVIAVSHQNLHIHNPLLSFSYQIYNADELLELYEKYDVKANFSGHVHIQSAVTGSVPEITTASLAVPNSQYGKLTYDGKSLSYESKETDVEAYAIAQGWTNRDLLNFREYSRNYFMEVAREQVYDSYKESNLSTDEIALLAETFAKINVAYFSGEEINEADYTEGLALWRAQENSFVMKYIDSMLSQANADKRNISIQLR